MNLVMQSEKEESKSRLIEVFRKSVGQMDIQEIEKFEEMFGMTPPLVFENRGE